MKPKHFVYLAFVTAISVLFAIVSFVAHNQWSPGTAVGAKLFPALGTDAGKVATIEVRRGPSVVVLERQGNAWGLKERAGYPAESEKIKALVVKLVEAELVEAKTRNPEKYQLLELEDAAVKDSKSRLVRLLDANGGVVAEAVVGKKRWEAFGAGKGGTYVRKPGDAQTWLANVEVDPSAAVKDWVKASVLETDTGKLSRITIEVPGEEALKIEREGGKDAKDGKLRFLGLPEGKKLKDASAADTLARAAANIDMEDVRKSASTPAGGGAGVVKLEAEGGLAVTLRLVKEGDAHWLSIAATGEGDAKAKAEEIGKRTQGWEFKVPASKAEALLKRRADLLEAS